MRPIIMGAYVMFMVLATSLYIAAVVPGITMARVSRADYVEISRIEEDSEWVKIRGFLYGGVVEGTYDEIGEFQVDIGGCISEIPSGGSVVCLSRSNLYTTRSDNIPGPLEFWKEPRTFQYLPGTELTVVGEIYDGYWEGGVFVDGSIDIYYISEDTEIDNTSDYGFAVIGTLLLIVLAHLPIVRMSRHGGLSVLTAAGLSWSVALAIYTSFVVNIVNSPQNPLPDPWIGGGFGLVVFGIVSVLWNSESKEDPTSEESNDVESAPSAETEDEAVRIFNP